MDIHNFWSANSLAITLPQVPVFGSQTSDVTASHYFSLTTYLWTGLYILETARLCTHFRHAGARREVGWMN
jgi:hypothetical protein